MDSWKMEREIEEIGGTTNFIALEIERKGTTKNWNWSNLTDPIYRGLLFEIGKEFLKPFLFEKWVNSKP